MHIVLSNWDLGLAASLVLALAALSFRLKLSLTRSLLVAALRTAVQLSLVGLVLQKIFHAEHWLWLVLIATVMLLVASFEVRARLQHKLGGVWSLAVGSISMFCVIFPLVTFSLVWIIEANPWYRPQYLVPLLGMLLGNAMSSVAIAMDSMTKTAWQQRHIIEARLCLGQNRAQAIDTIFRSSLHTAMIPIINAMAAAGVVSLPGMMTGQMLAGTSPVEAVKYQILIMFLIATATGFSSILSLSIVKRRLFDQRHRLRLDRLQTP